MPFVHLLLSPTWYFLIYKLSNLMHNHAQALKLQHSLHGEVFVCQCRHLVKVNLLDIIRSPYISWINMFRCYSTVLIKCVLRIFFLFVVLCLLQNVWTTLNISIPFNCTAEDCKIDSPRGAM